VCVCVHFVRLVFSPETVLRNACTHYEIIKLRSGAEDRGYIAAGRR